MKKQIDFKTLCSLCRYNGANDQEYGRMCPSPEHCLHPHTRDKNNERVAKNQEICPLWKNLE